MNLLQNADKVEMLHKLILERKTGTPKQLAAKLGVCRTCLFILIDDLAELNRPVHYSRKYETYYYLPAIKSSQSGF